MKPPGKILVTVMLITASLSGFGQVQAAEFPQSEEWWQTATPAQIEQLLAGGADVNARAESRQPPLHRAAIYNKNPAVIEALLQAGTNPKLRDNNGKLPADYAAENEHIKYDDIRGLLKDAR